MAQQSMQQIQTSPLHSSPRQAAVTGLKPGEPKFLREQFAKVVHTEAAEDRPRALQALDDLDRGARNAINRVCQAAGVRADELSNADAEPVDEAA